MVTVAREQADDLAVPPARTLLSFMPTAGTFLALCAAVAGATFLESDSTRNDFERFPDQRLLVLFLALFVGIGLAYVRTALQPPALNRVTIVAVALGALALLLCSMPVGSRDLYLYAFYGKMWTAYDTNPYVHLVADFTDDPWQPYVQMQWSHRHMIYGPLFLWQSRLASAIAGDNIFIAVWILKGMGAATLVALWSLVARIDATTRGRGSGALLLIAWNPLLLFEAVGNGHNDVMMALLLIAAVWCWQQDRPLSSVTLLALSFWYKWYGLLLLPVFLVAALRQHGRKATVRLAAACAVVLIAAGAVLLHWLPGAASAIAEELRNPVALTQIYPTELSPVLAPWFWLLRVTGVLDSERGADIFHGGRMLLFVSAYLAILVRQWRLPPSVPLLIESAFLASLAFSMLLMTILWPWHLMVPICLGLLTGRAAFVAIAIGLTITGLLSYFLTFAFATLGLVLIVGALAFLRRGQALGTVVEDA